MEIIYIYYKFSIVLTDFVRKLLINTNQYIYNANRNFVPVGYNLSSAIWKKWTFSEVVLVRGIFYYLIKIFASRITIGKSFIIR